MAMKLVKKTEEYSIYRRGDERYAVQDANKKPVNGEEKARILVAEDLIKVTLPAKPVVEEVAEIEAVAEKVSAVEEEAPAEAAPAEEAAAEEAAQADASTEVVAEEGDK